MTRLLNIDRLQCRYGGDKRAPAVVSDLSFDLADGEIGCLLGQSGCGKTTVLRCIAGFQSVEAGTIALAGKILSSPDWHLAPEKRQIGMVFQDYALFPHLNVRDNITFGVPHLSRRERNSLCEELLTLIKLGGFGHRFPHELSGGQQQRVALARALAPEPQLLLLDEPLSSLDTELRRGLALEIRSILNQRGTSGILVTHDQQEAYAFADRIGVLHQGRVQQWDIPYNIYHQPANRYVANFVGQGVFLPGFLRNGNTIETELGPLSRVQPFEWSNNTPVEVLIRPDDIVQNPLSPFRARIISKIFAGTSTLYKLKLPTGSIVEAALTSHDNYDIGTDIGIVAEADHVIAFKRDPSPIKANNSTAPAK